MTMRSEDPLDPSPPTLASRWRRNLLDVEAGRPPALELTPAQIAAVKSSVGFSCGNGFSRPSWGSGRSRAVLPICSGRVVRPGEVEPFCARIDNGSSGTDAWFPEQALFSRQTLDSFAIEEMSLRPWKEAPIRLLSRALDGRIDVARIDSFFRQVALPACDDLEIVVRNIDDAPRFFSCSILYYERVSDPSAESEEEARRIEASPSALRRQDAKEASRARASMK